MADRLRAVVVASPVCSSAFRRGTTNWDTLTESGKLENPTIGSDLPMQSELKREISLLNNL